MRSREGLGLGADILNGEGPDSKRPNLLELSFNTSLGLVHVTLVVKILLKLGFRS